MKHPEVRALVRDAMLNDWRGQGDAIAILEHEQHALCDFCSEVYDAWDKVRARLEHELARNAREFAQWPLLDGGQGSENR